MAFILEPYIVYIKANADNYITAINSSAFLLDTTTWIEIDSGYGDKYHHAQNNYFLEPIITESGVWRYKLVNNLPIECTLEEIAAQEEALIELEKPEEPEESEEPEEPEESEKPVLDIYDEFEAAYNEGVNSI